MKLQTNENGAIEFREIFEPITFITESDERLTICIRNKGFEISYNDVVYACSKQKGELVRLTPNDEDND